jgi:predicted anti-sigma-YlaC factor YlaD
MKTETDDLDCRRAARWLSRLLDQKLSAADRATLEHHLSTCDDCRNVEQQMQMLRRVMRGLSSDDKPAG